ncbi:hypothetical protein CYMTET_20102 [Cymbomonas tetramitiformis]|uniref:Iron-sulfur cluster biosynthesis family protein n=1 Tax=Cymbomonas tetramitiformis TaxID=36881 RepID=A0AAE0L4A6_9CHLO|nr:hypothetical protein CYMTET_20102 [Cymbomonas tetramitiformis]
MKRAKRQGNMALRQHGICRAQREVESDKLDSRVRTGVVEALEALGERVTVGDVAARAGLKVTEVEVGMRTIAADTLATLEVSDSGEIVYKYPKDVRGALRAKSFAFRIEPLLEKVAEAAAFGVRVAFGSALVISVILVWVTIIVLLSRGKSSRSSSSRSSGRGMFRLPSFRSGGGRRTSSRSSNMNFLEAVFSFVFGDGDPNEGTDEKRWYEVAQLIRNNNGVVTAEQLAPWLDLQSEPDLEGLCPDEAHVVPVLQRYEGEPVVSEEGRLLYWFPRLQKKENFYSDYRPSAVFQERPWTFSLAGGGQIAMVVLLGLANIGGIVYLTSLVKTLGIAPDVLFQNGFDIVDLTIWLLPALQVYGASFFTIPLVRSLGNALRNRGIQRRNQMRTDASKSLELEQTKRKIESARQLAETKIIEAAMNPEKTIYTTEVDMDFQPEMQKLDAELWEQWEADP